MLAESDTGLVWIALAHILQIEHRVCTEADKIQRSLLHGTLSGATATFSGTQATGLLGE